MHVHYADLNCRQMYTYNPTEFKKSIQAWLKFSQEVCYSQWQTALFGEVAKFNFSPFYICQGVNIWKAQTSSVADSLSDEYVSAQCGSKCSFAS